MNKTKTDNGNKLIRSSAVVLVAMLVAKLSALFEDSVVASMIGTTDTADSYYMSADVIQLFWYFGTLGIVRVFLPEYKKKLTNSGSDSAERYSDNMMSLFTIFSLSISILLLLFSLPLVKLVAYGFTSENKQICSEYVRYRTPQILFWCWTAMLTAKLQSNNKFLVSKIPEILVHIPVIVISIILFKKYGIITLFLGLFIGSIIGFLSQLIFSDNQKLFTLSFDLREEGVKDSLKRMPAAFVSAALTQINSMIDKIMASSLISGAVSSLSYGHKMYTAVNGLISGAISTVSYPKITEYVAKGNNKELGDFLRNVLRLLLFIMIPFSFGLVLFSKELTTILFMRGAFNADSVKNVSVVFSTYAVGLCFSGASNIIQLVYFAYGDTRTPMITSIIGITCNIVLNLILVRIFEVYGISAASSCAAIITFSCLLYILKSRIRIINASLVLNIVKTLILSLISCFTAYYIACYFITLSHDIIKLIVGGTIGIVMYAVLTFLFDKDIFKIARTL